jgi:hypothetical protein
VENATEARCHSAKRQKRQKEEKRQKRERQKRQKREREKRQKREREKRQKREREKRQARRRTRVVWFRGQRAEEVAHPMTSTAGMRVHSECGVRCACLRRTRQRTRVVWCLCLFAVLRWCSALECRCDSLFRVSKCAKSEQVRAGRGRCKGEKEERRETWRAEGRLGTRESDCGLCLCESARV